MNVGYRVPSAQFLGLLASVAALCGCGAQSGVSGTADAAPTAGPPAASAPVASAPVATAPVAGAPIASAPPNGATNPPTAGSPTGGSQSPTISGTPTNQALIEQPYAFTPTIGAVTGTTATFTIGNLPSWASFNAATGELSGTPTPADVGTYSNISISVRDGANGTSASLPPFSIAVVQSASGSAVISWSPPTENVDGATIASVAGYRIFYGLSAASLTQTVDVAPSSTTAIVGNLLPGIWYFDVRAFTSSGQESAASTVGSKTIL